MHDSHTIDLSGHRASIKFIHSFLFLLFFLAKTAPRFFSSPFFDYFSSPPPPPPPAPVGHRRRRQVFPVVPRVMWRFGWHWGHETDHHHHHQPAQHHSQHHQHSTEFPFHDDTTDHHEWTTIENNNNDDDDDDDFPNNDSYDYSARYIWHGHSASDLCSFFSLCLFAAFSSNCYRLITIVVRLSQSRKLCNKTTAHIYNSTFFMPWFYVPFCPVSYWSEFFLIEILGRKIVSKKVSNLPKIAFFLNSIHHGRTWCYLMLPHLFSLMNRHLFFLLSLYGRVFWTGFDANYANFSWTYFYRVLCEPSYPRL